MECGIRRVEERPVCFDFDGFEWFELWDKELYGYMALRVRGKRADIHMEITRWSHNVLKYMKREWRAEFKRLCVSEGVEEVIGHHRGIDSTFGKFARHMGFCEPVVVQYSRMEVGHG